VGRISSSWVTLVSRFARPASVHRVRRNAAERLAVLGPLLNRRSGLAVRSGVLLYKQLIRSMYGLRMPDLAVRCPQPRPEAAGVSPIVFELRLTHFGASVTGKFERIWGFLFSTNISEHRLRDVEGVCADRVLTEVRTVNPGAFMPRKLSEAVPQPLVP
jgi:hypothetical protein